MFRASVAATAWSDNKDSVTTASRECWRRNRAGLRLRDASPARRELRPIPPETIPETRQNWHREHTPNRRRQQDGPDDPEGYRRFFFVEAPRLRRCLAVHQRTPKSLRTDRTRVAPVEIRLAIVRHAAVVGVAQALRGMDTAPAFDINVAAT